MPQSTQDELTLAMRCSKTEPAVDGSGIDTCDSCGEDVWISPATRESIDKGLYPDKIRCVTCHIKNEEGDDA